MGKVIIMRGLPGSGKSTHIRPLINRGYNVVSADHYFINERGEYTFDPSELSAAHNSCMRKFLHAVNYEDCKIIVDNTNIEAFNYTPYIQVALALGHEVRIIEIHRNIDECKSIHNVPMETIERMATLYEKTIPRYKQYVTEVHN